MCAHHPHTINPDVWVSATTLNRVLYQCPSSHVSLSLQATSATLYVQYGQYITNKTQSPGINKVYDLIVQLKWI